MEERLGKILSCYEGKNIELIPILQQVQSEFGYLPEETMRKVAKFVVVPESKVYAVATFYEQFRFTPMGKNKVTVCRGTACHVRGAEQILEKIEDRLDIKEGETTEDQNYTLETAACIGCCALAPCVMVNDDVKAKLTTKNVDTLFVKEA
ncbi:MAG: NADH-quinone oxidoreductase subunit NuoE [Desulfobacula sp.]|jgi:NADH-quinone oxidoreductase subunit E|uniref:NADH-quinone oxidoreductase subunit NuoE n=1 Tax=Desulfobacula sp. TaxID=2593537 RepID=UPI001D74BC98|nr:NADH-quinone oxidoreductase subunit NuoE [Desulfobacula sp.]MBT3483803.1 NADH-quinone oxidoreductase subunit NuoE [Desulfobacula sp.]MBT3802991.1 NADH-quinone oxidoreductase subunit NuoE [Desulfobacula sp.]MBT4023496.1 NADH-quinone oxidoreductase subunit NuoE [Desulfobacula sp.]MBT4197039.1 NADH-quinone oxidoreductase subunit NuoE [Desulfobacula sp.]